MSLLHRIYRLASGLAAFLVAAIALVVIVQIVCRLIGVPIKGADDFAAWSMAAATFLALPQTMVNGEHIRITLFLQFANRMVARMVAFTAELISFSLASWAAWSVVKFVYSSYQLGDVSQGELSFPLWIPQLSMAAGLVLLAAACAERVVTAISASPSTESSPEISHVE